MPVSHMRRCIFVHVPKTGGTSVEVALGMHGRWQDENREAMFGLIQSSDLLEKCYISAFLQHLTIREIRGLLTEDAARAYFSFSFVRNPWDRMVSLFQHIDPHLLRHARARGIELSSLSFPEFVVRSGEIVHAHLMEQAQYVCDDADRVVVDMVGRFETLAVDFLTVCQRLHLQADLPHLNASTRAQYRNYYDEASRRLVEGRYQRDIDLFGYRF